MGLSATTTRPYVIIMTVWKDATEASIKWPKTKKPTIEDLLNDAHEMFHDEDLCYAFKAGFFYGIIQILEAERKASA
jgi:hypothetical protein